MKTQKVTLDGVSYSGKTTIITTLSEKDCFLYVPEYSQIGNLPPFSRATQLEVSNAIAHIISLEKLRLGHFSSLLQNLNKEQFVLFDRSWLSCLAFEYVVQKLGLHGDIIEMAKAFDGEFDSDYLSYQSYIGLQNDYANIVSRERQCLESGRGKNIDFLRRKDVIDAFQDFFLKFHNMHLQNANSLTLWTKGKSIGDLLAEVESFVVYPVDKQYKQGSLLEMTTQFLDYYPLKNKIMYDMGTVYNKPDPRNVQDSPYNREKYTNIINTLPGELGKVLELGCGEGALTILLSPQADHIDAIDVAEAAVVKANQLGIANATFMETDMVKFNFENKYDNIIACEILGYLIGYNTMYDVIQFLKKLYDNLSEGGNITIVNTILDVDIESNIPNNEYYNYARESYYSILSALGLTIASREIYEGVKNGSKRKYEILVFNKPIYS